MYSNKILYISNDIGGVLTSQFYLLKNVHCYMLWELPDYSGPDVQFWNYYWFNFPKTFIPRQVENISSYKSIVDSLEQTDITLNL